MIARKEHAYYGGFNAHAACIKAKIRRIANRYAYSEMGEMPCPVHGSTTEKGSTAAGL